MIIGLIFLKNGAYKALTETLSFWAANNEKPIVLFLDEIDALVGDTLISVLRQKGKFNSSP